MSRDVVQIRYFEIPKPTPELFRPWRIGLETRHYATYGQRGAARTDMPHCIFQYTLSGQVWFEDAQGRHVVPAGSGFLCESHDPAVAYCYPPAVGEPYEFLYLSFSGATAHAMVRALVTRYGHLWALPRTDRVIRHLQGLLSDRTSLIFMNEADGVALVSEVLCGLLQLRQEQVPGAHDAVLVRLAKDEIERRLETQRCNLIRLSEKLRVTKEHLCRVFRKNTGMTPYQYIQRRQMLLACKWLTESTRSVKEVAAALGYDTPGNFSRTFRRQLGMAPGTYRLHGNIPMLE
ncbi:MAG: AraC family transcriptional regulator [Lentisphaeria bacterium]